MQTKCTQWRCAQLTFVELNKFLLAHSSLLVIEMTEVKQTVQI